MQKRHAADSMRRFFLIGLIWVLAACSPSIPPENSRSANPKEATMGLAHNTETAELSIPLIDQAAPANFETASFGLG